MRFLLYGHKGWIGGQFAKLLEKSNIDFVKGQSRVEDAEPEIQSVNPTHVIAFTGRTHGTIGDKEYTTIDYLEQPSKLIENVRDNLFAPIKLANLSTKYNFHFTYLGTGCIFESTPAQPTFDESSTPNFFGSSYSIVKGYTDQLMHQYSDTTLNVRIRMPITSDLNPRNFIAKILKYDKICSMPNSMTVLPELLPILLDMICSKLTGTINLTNPGTITHNEILEMYRDIIDPAFEWKNFTVEEQNEILAAGRSNNELDTTLLESMYPEVMSIHASIRKVIENMKDEVDA
jgi:3,5-epimerase/4-reductase